MRRRRNGVSPWLWAWFIMWTAADAYTTIVFTHMGVGYELNPFINGLAAFTGFDAAVVITAALSVALMWALAKTRLCAALLAAKTFMATRFLAPLNNALILTANTALVDYLTAAGIDPHAAVVALGLAAILPTATYFTLREVKRDR